MTASRERLDLKAHRQEAFDDFDVSLHMVRWSRGVDSSAARESHGEEELIGEISADDGSAAEVAIQHFGDICGDSFRGFSL